jgi:hypothetical protein
MTTPDRPRPREGEPGREAPFKAAVRRAARLHHADTKIVREEFGEHNFTVGDSSLRVVVSKISRNPELHVQQRKHSSDEVSDVQYSLTQFGEVKIDDVRTKYRQVDALLTIVYGSQDDPAIDTATTAQRKKAQKESYRAIAEERRRKDDTCENIATDNELRNVIKLLRDGAYSSITPNDEALGNLDHESLISLFMETTERLATHVIYTSYLQTASQDMITVMTTTDTHAKPLHVLVSKNHRKLDTDETHIESWDFDNEKRSLYFSDKLMVPNPNEDVGGKRNTLEFAVNEVNLEKVHNSENSARSNANADQIQAALTILGDPENIKMLEGHLDDNEEVPIMHDLFLLQSEPNDYPYNRPPVEIDLTFRE